MTELHSVDLFKFKKKKMALNYEQKIDPCLKISE